MLSSLPIADAADLNRVLLVKLSSLGDIVHTLPLLDALRAGLPEKAHIGWAVRGKFAVLLDGNPNLSAAYILTESGPEAVLRFGKQLRAENFDAALDAQGLLVSGFVTRLSGSPLRIGFDANREGNALFLTHPTIPAKQRMHVVERLRGFCDALGIPRLPIAPQTYLANAESAAAEKLLSKANGEGPLIGCIVGASTPEKTYPIEKWAETARLLSKSGAQVVLLGGPKEAESARAIIASAGSVIAADLTGKTPLRVLASVLARCAVVIGGDSGPTHLAVAVGTPVVGLYGVTDPERTGPHWGCAPSVTLDYAEKDAPPESRRPRHPTLTDALARIPAAAVVEAALTLAGKNC